MTKVLDSSYFLLLFLPLFLFFSFPEVSSATCKNKLSFKIYGTVKAPVLSLRSTPVKGHNLLQKMPKGRKFIVLKQKKNGWIQIIDTTTCKKGWIAKQYTKLYKKKSTKHIIPPHKLTRKKCTIKSSTKTSLTVTSDWLNLRAKPEIGKNVISKLLQGQNVIFLQEGKAGWIQIQDTNSCKKGWVAKRYTKRQQKKTVKKEPAIPPSAATIEICVIENPTNISAIITSKWLNFRTEPKIGKNIINKLLQGKTVMVLPKKKDGWIMVQDTITCKKGWIASKYTKVKALPETPFSGISVKHDKKTSPETTKVPSPSEVRNDATTELPEIPIKKKIAKKKKVTKPIVPVSKKCVIKEKSNKTSATITSEWLNFRSEPKIGTNIINKIFQGQKVIVVAENNNGWLQVQDTTSCKKGWIAKRYTKFEKKPTKQKKYTKTTKKNIQKKRTVQQPAPVLEKCTIKETTGTFASVKSEWLNLRSEPKLDKNIIAKLPQEQRVMLLSKRNNKWVQVQETTRCKKGWVVESNLKFDKNKSIKETEKPVSPIFLTSIAKENFIKLKKSAERRISEKKERLPLIHIPVSTCMKKLKKDIIGYGRVKFRSLKLVSEQDMQSKVAGSFPIDKLLTIIETAIDWFYVVEEKSCTVGWVPRKQVSHMTIKHPFNIGRGPIERETLTPCLIKLKRDTPIGFATVAHWSLLYIEARIPTTNELAGELSKGTAISIMKLDNNWLEIIEEESCKSGWIPYGSVANITFERPKSQ